MTTDDLKTEVYIVSSVLVRTLAGVTAVIFFFFGMVVPDGWNAKLLVVLMSLLFGLLFMTQVRFEISPKTSFALVGLVVSLLTLGSTFSAFPEAQFAGTHLKVFIVAATICVWFVANAILLLSVEARD